MNIAVVIPTKNEERCLPVLLHALKNQTRQPNEVAIGDGGSTDATREIAMRYGAKVVDGGSPSLGRNAGAAQTSSEILMFFDADAIVDDTRFIEKAIADFETRELDIATADIFVRRGTLGDRLGFRFYNFYVRMWGNHHPHLIGTFMMVRRHVHNVINGFDKTVTFAEDHDYGLRAKKSGARFGVLNGIAVGITPRRQEKIGRMRFFLVNALAEPYIMFVGPIRSGWFADQYKQITKEQTQM